MAEHLHDRAPRGPHTRKDRQMSTADRLRDARAIRNQFDALLGESAIYGCLGLSEADNEEIINLAYEAALDVLVPRSSPSEMGDR